MASHDLNRMLRFSPGRAARQATGRNPERLAGALAIEHNVRVTALLQEFNDSYLGQDFQVFTRLCKEMGFRYLQREKYWANGQAESWIMERDGWLLFADSYQQMVNQATLLIRVKQGRRERALALDARQGIRHLIDLYHPKARRVIYRQDCELLPADTRSRAKVEDWPRRLRRRLKAGS